MEQKPLSTSIDCPKCRLTNPVSSEACDCGYNFITREVNLSCNNSKTTSWSFGDILGVLVIGLLYAVLVYYSNKKEDPERARRIINTWAIILLLKIVVAAIFIGVSSLKK